jgi:5-bromo-4-chloroindolyl phosphate hydrolysis protein
VFSPEFPQALLELRVGCFALLHVFSHVTIQLVFVGGIVSFLILAMVFSVFFWNGKVVCYTIYPAWHRYNLYGDNLFLTKTTMMKKKMRGEQILSVKKTWVSVIVQANNVLSQSCHRWKISGG